ncbi:MAG: metalloregulator ArsR/SmtB family transcription factor [Bacilli bacterium]|jgi:ArsR family transcriptional regulator
MDNIDTNKKDLVTIKKEQLSGETFDKLSSFFSLFGDSTRLSIIALLSDNELCVNDIADVLKMSQSAVSHQLAVLRKYDIVYFYRKGKQVLYTLSDNHIKDLFLTGLEHASEKDAEIYKDKKKKGL